MTTEAALNAALDRLLRLAGTHSLDAVESSTSYGTPALKVGGSTFVRLLDESTAVLQCPTDQKVLLMEISPGIYFETDHFVGYDAVLIRLDKISDEELALRLQDAWTFKAPAKLKAH
ncbi:MAG: MmcQ/YjbR family DNA-binding protein [Devosia sp.]|uniref:MmcQ/YjbR family DNA-binding protein n=1 Tax=Devosia sp. TaxID=1871048 RepID=UPI0024C955EF|nr:MmcQ/YjbR family DNA-binding protein [Devosia sp.]UYO00154.1 MAG: MmcQ/YjbR family DNA-binding protein [Devosia sp.]